MMVFLATVWAAIEEHEHGSSEKCGAGGGRQWRDRRQSDRSSAQPRGVGDHRAVASRWRFDGAPPLCGRRPARRRQHAAKARGVDRCHPHFLCGLPGPPVMGGTGAAEPCHAGQCGRCRRAGGQGPPAHQSDAGLQSLWGPSGAVQDAGARKRRQPYAARVQYRSAGLSRTPSARPAVDVVGNATIGGDRFRAGQPDEPGHGHRALCRHVQGVGAAAALSGHFCTVVLYLFGVLWS